MIKSHIISLIRLTVLVFLVQQIQTAEIFGQLGYPNNTQGSACMVFSRSANQGALGTGYIDVIKGDSNTIKRLFPSTPVSILTNLQIGVLITARHLLYQDPDTMKNLVTDLYVKFNRNSSSKSKSWLHIPLCQTEPHNYWFSERGFDLAVIPIPNNLLSDAQFITTAGNFLTAKNYKEFSIRPGRPAIASVIQFEFLDERDFQNPEIIPLLRSGHVARLGVLSETDTNQFSREHVVDIHASHGNSGSPVLVYKDDGVGVLLGLIKGFPEERWARHQLEAPITNKIINVSLTGTGNTKTNQFAITMITEANPNLMWVTPVEELDTLGKNDVFLVSVDVMGKLSNEGKYSTVDLTVPPWLNHPSPTLPPPPKSLPPQPYPFPSLNSPNQNSPFPSLNKLH